MEITTDSESAMNHRFPRWGGCCRCPVPQDLGTSGVASTGRSGYHRKARLQPSTLESQQQTSDYMRVSSQVFSLCSQLWRLLLNRGLLVPKAAGHCHYQLWNKIYRQWRSAPPPALLAPRSPWPLSGRGVLLTLANKSWRCSSEVCKAFGFYP
jgi:hypothetical protein